MLTADQRERAGKLVSRFGDENDAEVLAAARALARTADPLELGAFIAGAELPEPVGGALSRIVRRMLVEISTKAWALKAQEIETLNDLQAKFTAGGKRLPSAELDRLDRLYTAARRRA